MVLEKSQRILTTALGPVLYMANASSGVMAQPPAKVSGQGININSLFGKERLAGFAEFAQTRCLPHMNPIIRLVTGSLVSLCVHKGLKEIKRMVV